MLTYSQIKNHEFSAPAQGLYHADEVDDFLETVAGAYDDMFRENGELVKKISLLAEKLEKYKNDEESLSTALFNAQKLADQITRESKQNAKDLETQTSVKTQKMLDDAKSSASEIRESASEQSTRLVSDAKTQAETMVNAARTQANDIISAATKDSATAAEQAKKDMLAAQRELDLMKAKVSEFKGEISKRYKEHLSDIAKLPELASEEVEKIYAASEEAERAAAQAAADKVARETAAREAAAQLQSASKENSQPKQDDSPKFTFKAQVVDKRPDDAYVSAPTERSDVVKAQHTQEIEKQNIGVSTNENDIAFGKKSGNSRNIIKTDNRFFKSSDDSEKDKKPGKKGFSFDESKFSETAVDDDSVDKLEKYSKYTAPVDEDDDDEYNEYDDEYDDYDDDDDDEDDGSNKKTFGKFFKR